FRQGKPEEKTGRFRALGGKIGEVHPQGLAGDRSRRIVRKEVHSGDQHILGRDNIMARLLGENRGIVAQTKGPRPRERREVGRDQFFFGRTRHGFAFYPRGSNSAARHWRARASSTALIIPASSGPKKAPAISTYSLIETRAGTSARASNSEAPARNIARMTEPIRANGQPAVRALSISRSIGPWAETTPVRISLKN